MKKLILYLVLFLFLTSCMSYSQVDPPSFQATLDSMVQATLTSAPTSTPTQTPTVTPEPTVTATPLPTDTPELVTSTPEPERGSSLTEREAVLTFTPTPTEVGVLACLNRMNALNVRELPDLDSVRVDILEKTDCTEIIGRTEDKVWGKIKEGWVPLEFLDIASKIEKLPIFNFKK